MKKTLTLLSVFCLGVTLFISCQKDNNSSSVKLRDRQEVYDEDINEIELYLQNNYLDINDDFKVKPVESGETSIWDDQTNSSNLYPLQFINVRNDVRTNLLTTGEPIDDVEYKLYYIIINEGLGQNPTVVDSTLTAYKGWNLENEVFDENKTGVWFTYPETTLSSISGFRQILSKIKSSPAELPDVNLDGTVFWPDSGRVIVFIPSGLGYFSSPVINIGAYNPIAFDIKLFKVEERDHDNDQVPSNYENFSYDLNGNRIYGVVGDSDFFNDDTDGDTIPDFLDVDDDGDGYLTKYEIKKPSPYLGSSLYYPFNTISDNPLTPEDETEPKGIPDASGEGTNPIRLRRHLDPNTTPPYNTY